MKKVFRFSNGDTVEADAEGLKNLLANYREYVQNYTELLSSLEDDEYVARGNGFCDRKFSDSFIEGQIEKYSRMAAETESWLAEMKNET